MDVGSALQRGVIAHQNGDLLTAEKLYLAVLSHDPDQADACNLLGVINQQSGKGELALEYFDRAIAASPKEGTFHFNRANALRDLNRFAEASAAYKRALEQDPELVGARLNLGVLDVRAGKFVEARGHFQRALEREPSNTSALLNLGKCLHLSGEIDKAFRTLKRTIELSPEMAEAHLALARVLIDANNFDAALPYSRKAAELDPTSALAHEILSIVLSMMGMHLEAMEESSKALDLRPSEISVATRHAWNCHKAGRSEEGLKLFEDLCAQQDATEQTFVGYAEVLRDMRRPWDALSTLHGTPSADSSPIVLTNIGATFQDLDLPALATQFFRRAANLNGNHLKPIESLAFQLLQLGQLEDGWEQLDRRLSHSDLTERESADLPFWRGEDLTDKTLFVFFEQGAGEHIIQSSMISAVTSLAGHCIVECAARLVPVFERSIPNAEFISGLDQTAVQNARRNADYQIPGLHLGRHLRRQISDISQSSAPLKPDPDKVKTFREAYEILANGRRIVGLSWTSGSSNFGRKKTIPLEEIGALFDPEEVFVVSLQYGNIRSVAYEFAKEYGWNIHIDSSFDQMSDLESFFAQVASMDLVITISNTTAHVAGSTGTPTWVLLPSGGGAIWYWFLDRSDSPWYPSARLFRSGGLNDAADQWWSSCISHAKNALDAWLNDDDDQPL